MAGRSHQPEGENDPRIGAEVREHMRRLPDHEMTIDSSDEWVCLTCEKEEEDQE